jgi:hypothetical protein
LYTLHRKLFSAASDFFIFFIIQELPRLTKQFCWCGVNLDFHIFINNNINNILTNQLGGVMSDSKQCVICGDVGFSSPGCPVCKKIIINEEVRAKTIHGLTYVLLTNTNKGSKGHLGFQKLESLGVAVFIDENPIDWHGRPLSKEMNLIGLWIAEKDLHKAVSEGIVPYYPPRSDCFC